MSLTSCPTNGEIVPESFELYPRSKLSRLTRFRRASQGRVPLSFVEDMYSIVDLVNAAIVGGIVPETFVEGNCNCVSLTSRPIDGGIVPSLHVAKPIIVIPSGNLGIMRSQRDPSVIFEPTSER